MEKPNPISDDHVTCENTDCEQFREWLSGEKAEADKRARHGLARMARVEAERDEARKQVTGMVRILTGLLRHADLTDDVRVEIQNALDGSEAGR